MLLKVAASAFVFALVINLASCLVDYCGRGLCGLTGYRHITCGATGKFAPSCPSDALVVPMTSQIQQQLMDLHNENRNRLAGGYEPGFHPATRMTTMKWNNELAEYAELNVRRCTYERDCHNTPVMKYAGQNINFEAGTTNFAQISTFIDETVAGWWQQKQYATQSNIDSAVGADSGPTQVYHFLEMASDRANQIGCAIAQFTDGQGKKTYIACNYSFTVIPKFAVYETGSAASKCQSGTNPKYPALCSVHEFVDPDNIS